MTLPSDDIHVVTKTEYHVLSSCPCESCQAERVRRESPLDGGSITVPVRTARVLGLIPNPNPYGSLARQIREEGLAQN